MGGNLANSDFHHEMITLYGLAADKVMKEKRDTFEQRERAMLKHMQLLRKIDRFLFKKYGINPNRIFYQ